MRSADRNAANLLRALIELMPGGAFITQALDNHGVINKAAAWVEQKIAILGDIGGDIVGGLKRFIDSLSWTDIFDLGGVWDRAKRIFTEPIARLISFGGSVVIEILKMVKDADPQAPGRAWRRGHAATICCASILGEDPITGEPVPRTRGEPARRLHEADRPGGDLGEHQEGQRHRPRVRLVPGRARGADGPGARRPRRRSSTR